MGPYTFNFAEAAQNAQQAGGAVRVSDMDSALNQVMAWLRQPAELENARQKGLDLVAQSRGAAQRYASVITGLI
jgi:3-deoxy-D-manno-octulosonic-acid transferase